MTPLHIQTPLLESRALSELSALSALSPRSVWLKLEALQPAGSFKIRGIGLACQEHVRRGAKRFICSSGGNAGIAVAYAGRRLGVPVVVVSDQAAVAACLAFMDDHRVVVEPACGAALAVVYHQTPALDSFKSVLVIVCGGVTATVAQLQKWSADLA